MLVYYEIASDMVSAIAREKQIEGWVRAKKVSLIESTNPNWLDPSVRVTDVQMPRLDGVELVQRLRASPPTRAIPVGVVAASRASREAAMEAGGNGYLDKPFDVEALIRKVQEHLPAGYGSLAG